MRSARLLLLIAALAACRHPQFAAVPGDTSIGVSAVTIEPVGETSVVYRPVLSLLGVRAKTLLFPERKLNDFRLAEDRRRIASFLAMNGRFDAEVDAPKLTWSASRTSVAVTWPVREGAPYTIGDVSILGAPPAHAAALRALIPFTAGAPIALEPYRQKRLELAHHLQDHGFGHARAYSRAFVDRRTKRVTWVYYVDAGPQTRIGTLIVEGHTTVTAATIIERAGLAVGAPFSTTLAHRAELALLDTGAFVSASVVTDADIHRLPKYPDTGGLLQPAQVNAAGALVPRALPTALAVRIVVVEAPATQLRAELGVEADPSRADVFTGTRVILRSLLRPQHHVVLEGNVGYGYRFDDGRVANGLYGSALAQWVHPLERAHVELRLGGRWRDVLYPDALLREVTVGPGLRGVPFEHATVELDALFRIGQTRDLPAVDPASAGDFTAEDSRGVLLVGSLVSDHRDDRVEPTRGRLLGVGGSYSPGGPLGEHRWLQLSGDARGFVPIGGPWSLALRAQAAVVLLPNDGDGDDGGVPLGPRLFGGGAYGMRGFGRDRLSPSACLEGATCARVLVGGRSLVETSVELRYLPFRKQVGAAAFVDVGGAGAGTNAFTDGVSLAAGVGARLRLWYVPIAIDLAYRLLDGSDAGWSVDRVQAFLRVGEAF